METKELRIEVPEGYEVDRENSTFECIKFKPKRLTYDDVAEELFFHKSAFFTTHRGVVISARVFSSDFLDANNACSEEQCNKLLALNKLINVAKYLNGDWKPNFSDYTTSKFFIKLEEENLAIISYGATNLGSPCFRTRELAEQAVEILGEETIRLALSQV